jgi:transposase InsO family protein
MLDRHGSYQRPVTSKLDNWENVAINSLLALHNLTPPIQAIIPPLLRIPILIFDIQAKGLIDTGAAASLLSSEVLFRLRDKNIKKLLNNENPPVIRTVSGQVLRTFGKFEFPITINKDHSFLHYFYVMEALQEDCILGIDFLSTHNVKVNTKNREIHYDHAHNTQILQTDCPIYSLSIGENNCDIPLTPYDIETLAFHPHPNPNPTHSRQPFSLYNGPDALDRALAKNPTSVPYSRIQIEPEIDTPSAPITINEADIKNNPTDTDPYDMPLDEKDHINLEPFRQFDIKNTSIISPVDKVEFDLKHLNTEQLVIVLDVLDKHEKLFSDKDSELGLAIDVKHQINTGNNPPVSMRQRRTPEALRPQVWKQLYNMIDNKIIRVSSSPYAAAIVMTLKKDGSLRLCIDYRWLNKITIKDKFPLPRIDDTIEALYGARYFSTLDLISGYWQIEIDEADKHKTAFICELGLFEFNRMPFGLTNAPSTFQRAMNNIFRTVLYKYVVVYLDDIIIYSKTFEDHLKHLAEVFSLLKDAGMRLNRTKCEFFKKEIEYLGYIISREGITPNNKKIDCVKNYPEPKNPKELGSFLGLASYYRKFVRAFAEIAHPLTALTKKKAIWKWEEEERDAFNCIKQRLVTRPVLSYPDFTREFIIYTDASGYGIGAVLAQMQPFPPSEYTDGTDEASTQEKHDREVVIAYTSKHLKDKEANRSTTERECHAIIHAIKAFRVYLYGRKFTVFTDHSPLEWLLEKKEPAGRLQRWALKLQEYDIVIGYRPGKSHQNADCLSRIPTPLDQAPLVMVATVTFTPRPGKPRANTTMKTNISEWAKLQRTDKYCQTLIERIRIETSQRAEDKVDTEHKVKEKCENSDVKKDEASQRADNRYILTDHRVRTSNSVEDENDDRKYLRKEADTIRGDHTKRYRYNENGEIIDINNRLIVPLVKVKEVLEENHDHMLAGHLGIAKTLAKIKRQYKWPQMKQHVVLHVNSCLMCARRKSFGATKAPLQPLPPVVAVWERIAMDVVGPIQESNKGYRYILVISDYASRFVFTIPMKNQTAPTIARCLVDKLITKYGAPQAVLTDRGTNFLSVLVNEICVLFKIKQMRTTSYHPQTDGLVERFNRTLCDMLACYVNKEPEEWDKFLPFVTFAYNTAIQSTLKECPFYLFFGRAPLLPNDITINPRYNTRYDDHNVYAEKWENAKKLAREHLFKAQTKQKENYDKGTKTRIYTIGDKVLLRAPPSAGKFINRWNGPFIITKSYSNVNYEIENFPKTKQKPVVVHSNRLKPYTERVPEIPAEIQRERMTKPEKTETKGRNITLGVQHHEQSPQGNQPVKRGRGRPRKNVLIPTKPTPATYPNRRTHPHPYTLRHASSRRDADFIPNYAHMLPRRDDTSRRNYPNTRSTRSQDQWRPQYSSNPISHPEYEHTCTSLIPKRDVPDIPVTRNADGQFVYHIPVATPYHSYRNNQQQNGTSHRDEPYLPRHIPHDRAQSQQTRYNLRRRF